MGVTKHQIHQEVFVSNIMNIKIRRIGEILTDGSILVMGSDKEGNQNTSSHRNILLAKIQKKSRISHSDLLRSFSYKMNAQEIAKAIATLTQDGFITKNIESGKTFYSFKRLPDVSTLTNKNILIKESIPQNILTRKLADEEKTQQLSTPINVIGQKVWAFRNILLNVQYYEYFKDEEIALYVKHYVLNNEKEIKKIRDQIQSLEKSFGKENTERSNGINMEKQIEVLRREGIQKEEIFSRIRNRWLSLTQEEWVRQNYVKILVNNYGYDLKQMAEEYCFRDEKGDIWEIDIVVWPKSTEKSLKQNAIIVVECKGDTLPVSKKDFEEGKRYALLIEAQFLVICKQGATWVWQVIHNKTPKDFEPVEDIPHALYTRLLSTSAIAVNEKLIVRSPRKWVREVKNIYAFHREKVEKHGETVQGRKVGWSLQQTAKEYNLSIGTISEAITLGKAMEKYPWLQNCYSKREALREYKKKEKKGIRWTGEL